MSVSFKMSSSGPAKPKIPSLIMFVEMCNSHFSTENCVLISEIRRFLTYCAFIFGYRMTNASLLNTCLHIFNTY